MTRTDVKAAFAVLAGAACLASGAAAAPAGGPAFRFGRTGGNIVPWSAAIAADGSITIQGPVAAGPTMLAPAALRKLTALLAAERFATLPAQISCPGTLPDIASRYITAAAAGRRRTVTVHGACNARFEKLYAALSAAAG